MSALSSISSSTSFPSAQLIPVEAQAQPAAAPVAIATPTTAQPAAPVTPNPNAELIANIQVWTLARLWVQLNLAQAELAKNIKSKPQDLAQVKKLQTILNEKQAHIKSLHAQAKQITDNWDLMAAKTREQINLVQAELAKNMGSKPQDLAQANTLQTTINAQIAHIKSLVEHLEQTQQSFIAQIASVYQQISEQSTLLDVLIKKSDTLIKGMEKSNELIDQLQFTVNHLQTSIQDGLSKVSPEIRNRVAALQALPREEFQTQMGVLQDQMPGWVMQCMSFWYQGKNFQEAMQAAQTAIAQGMAQLEHPVAAPQE